MLAPPLCFPSGPQSSTTFQNWQNLSFGGVGLNHHAHPSQHALAAGKGAERIRLRRNGIRDYTEDSLLQITNQQSVCDQKKDLKSDQQNKAGFNNGRVDISDTSYSEWATSHYTIMTYCSNICILPWGSSACFFPKTIYWVRGMWEPEIHRCQHDNTCASILRFTHMFNNIILTTVIILTDTSFMFYFLKIITMLTLRESQNRTKSTNLFCVFSLTHVCNIFCLYR